jgi:hypothetical protein
MHIPKFLVILFVTVLGASPLLAQRPDTDIQTKAREQLRQAMEQLNANSPVVGTNAVATKKEKNVAKPAVVTAPAVKVVTPTPVASTPAVVNPSNGLSAADEAKARESMRKAEKELAAQKKAAAAQAEASKPKVAPAVETAVAPKVVTPSPMPKVSAVVEAAPAPMVSAPAAGSKEQRLMDLLQAYKSDRISPTEYHAQRAKILAEQ